MKLKNKKLLKSKKAILTRTILISVSLIVAITVPTAVFNNKADACSSIEACTAEINNLNAQIAEYTTQANALSDQAATLKDALAVIASQKAVIQTQIDVSQAKYDKLSQQIAENEALIKTNQDSLGKIIADMYVDDEVTPIEMLASSSTISEYLDKQEYRSSVRSQLTSTINKIKKLKEELASERTQVDVVLTEQKAQRATLSDKESEQNNLLAQTEGEESNYQALIGKNQSAIAAAKAAQAAISSRFNNSGGYSLVSSGSLGDYPWNSSNCPMVGFLSTGGSDGNGGDGRGYGCRQCASYVAWRIAKETGRYYQWGNAVNFYGNAVAAGYTAGSARAGSIAVMTGATAGNGSYGHVAWVEAVSGNKVLISQYNYNYGAGYGLYSEMWLSVSAFDYYVHINPNN